MRLEKFEINGIDCLNIPKLDQSNISDDDWIRFGNRGDVKPINTAILRVGEKLENMTIKVNEEFEDNVYLFIVLPNGTYLENDYKLSVGENTINLANYSSDDIATYHIIINIASGDEYNLYWLELHGGTDFIQDNKGASDYFESIKIGGIELAKKVGNETDIIARFIRGDIDYPGSDHLLRMPEQLTKLELYVKDDYKNYYITIVNVYEDGSDLEVFTENFTGNDNGNYDEWTFPFERDGYDSVIFVISSIPFEQLQSDPSLLDTEFMIAYGSTFVVDVDDPDITLEDYEDWGETGQLVDPDSTQSVRVLDGTSLAEYSVVPDIYNVKVNKTINGPHTLTFNLQPYTNASNIYPPRILEMDNDFYIVQQIKKRRQIGSLEMDIHCEHLSYELNQPPSEFYSDEEGKFVWTEDTYLGTASEIIGEMLSYYNRFYIGGVDYELNYREYTFTTSTEGFRSRINEFASFIGAEVIWKKFGVYLYKPIVENSGLRLEVGKNIIGLTEIIDSTRHGRTTRSYEVDVVDLFHITDELENPLELMDIQLGDIVTLIDDQYGINRTDRIVSIEYDPFKKSLPIIELENNVKSFTNSGDSNSGASAPKMSIDYVIETARAQFSYGMFFEFTRPYSRVLSVTLSLDYDVPPTRTMSETVSTTSVENEFINVPPCVVYRLYTNRRGEYTGVIVYTQGSGTIGRWVEVSMQAICDPLESEEIRFEVIT